MYYILHERVFRKLGTVYNEQRPSNSRIGEASLRQSVVTYLKYVLKTVTTQHC